MELRWRVKYICLSGIWIGFCVVYNRGYILNRIGGFINGDDLYVGVVEYLDVLMRIWIIISFICVIPYFWFQIYVFFGRGMYKNERQKLGKIGVLSWLLLILGMEFGSNVVISGIENFIGGVINIEGSDEVEYLQVLGGYVSFLERILVGLICITQLPVFLWFLVNRVIIGLKKIYKWRRWVYLILFVIGGLISPPDVWSQLLLVVPIISLYEGWVLGLMFVRNFVGCSI